MTQGLRQPPIVTTVANLPAAARTDELFFVTDATHHGDVVTGGGTVGYFTRWDGSAYVGLTAVFVDGDGNVGIGTATPEHLLELEDSTSGNQDMLSLTSAAAAADSIFTAIIFSAQSSTQERDMSKITAKWDDKTDATRTSTVQIQAAQSGTIANRLTVKGDKVGIGNASPSERLTVGDGTNEARITSTGDVYFAGTGGMVYAGISAVDNTTETAIVTQGVAVQVTIFDTDNPNNLCTPDHTNDHITIVKTGDYFISVSATVNSVAGAASRFEMTVRKNNGATLVAPLHVDRNIAGGSGASGSVSMVGPATLTAGDTIEIWLENETGTANYVLENAALFLMQVGG